MSRLTASITIFCLLTVSVLGNGLGLLCIPVCQAEEIECDERQESLDYQSCCPSEPPAVEFSCCPRVQEMEPECPNRCCPKETPVNSKCCKCVFPNLTFIKSDYRIQVPETIPAEIPTADHSIADSYHHFSINDSRPPGIHPTISISVLRL
jgi:hypothetical protein